MKFRIIKPEEINLNDCRFRFTLEKPSEDFLKSIKEIGIAEPLLVIKKDKNFILVSGWKRLQAALSFGISQIPVLELSETLSERQLLTFAFFLYRSQRQLSLAEKSLVVKRFFEIGLEPEEIVVEIMPWLEVPPNRPTFDLLYRLANLEEILEEAHSRDWKLGMAELFLSFSSEERKVIFNLISGLSHSRQKEIIESIYILKKRLNKNILTILTDPEIAAVLSSFIDNRAKTADELVLILRKKINPLVQKIGYQLDQNFKALKLPAEIRFDYDRTLENPELRIEIAAGSKEQLRKTLMAISSSLEKENWEAIFSLLHGEINAED